MGMDTAVFETVADFAFGTAAFGDQPAQRVKSEGTWTDISYNDLSSAAIEIGLGLIDVGVRQGDRVSVLANTSAEWSQIQLGIAAAGAIVVPIYPSSSPEECEWVLGNSGAVAVVCEDASQVAKIEQIAGDLPSLNTTLVIEPDGTTTTLTQLRERGSAGDRTVLEERRRTVVIDDPTLIIYTSGTTGPPKGCVLTHRNLLAACETTKVLDAVHGDDIGYMFLPMAHIFAQICVISMTSIGGVMAYNSGGPTTIMPDCGEVSPTFLPSVPRIFEKIYSLFASRVPADSLTAAVRAGLAVQALETAGQPVPDALAQGFATADEQLFAKVRGALGGNVRFAISGAAPIAPEILEFFHAAGVPVCEGYGLSESTALGTLNTPTALKIGTVGQAIPLCELKIAEDGEILMRGPHIFAGYWNNPEATAGTLDDGWLLTGDLGSIDDDGYLSITGRKKDIIITAGGKNIAPANLENDLRQSPWISQAVMYGDRRPFPVVVVTLDAEQILPWAAENGLSQDLGKLAHEPAVRELVKQTLDEANSKYAQVARAKKFAILPADFTPETGELTPTLKVKRKVVSAKYADVFDALYLQAPAQ